MIINIGIQWKQINGNIVFPPLIEYSDFSYSFYREYLNGLLFVNPRPRIKNNMSITKIYKNCLDMTMFSYCKIHTSVK